jgi:ubiquitin-conjugating enzyme E2 variant
VSSRPRLLVSAEFASVASFAVLYGWFAARLARSIDDLAAFALALASVPVGMLAADLGSGLVHWACDRFFDERTPLLGPSVIYGFREHHREPQAMTAHGFFELNGMSCLVLVPLLGAALAVGPFGPFADGFVAVFTAGTALTNLFHSWAHAPVVPRVAVFAQRRGWILSPDHHALHHTSPYESAFCVTTGWANRWLDAAGFWSSVERAIRRRAPE